MDKSSVSNQHYLLSKLSYTIQSHSLCVLGSKPSECPYNRGWESQPTSVGLYTHYKDFLFKVG